MWCLLESCERSGLAAQLGRHHGRELNDVVRSHEDHVDDREDYAAQAPDLPVVRRQLMQCSDLERERNDDA
jgi:hypothetical protein